MFKEKWSTKKVIGMSLCCMLSMLLFFCFFLQNTFAWLSNNVEKQSVGTTNFTTITGGLNNTENTYELVMPNANSYLNISSYSTITNTGSLNALLRVFYSFTIDESAKQIATTSDFISVSVNSDFIASEENITNVYSGYYYYNKLLAPGASVPFISTVVPTSTIAGKTIKFNIFCELVNYEGGPYQLNQELPWDHTPASWFLNYDCLTKAQGSVVSPKLDVKFSEVSKVEITAKTATNVKNIFMGRYNNAYIGVNGSNWIFNGLVGGLYSMDPSSFCNGNYNTITFEWDGCTAATDDYISLIYDASWSKNISYKQIRIWNVAGELIYDLRPNITTSGLVPTSDGKFINKVDNTVLLMYTFSNGAATTTSEGYGYTGKVVYVNNFESYTNNQANVLTVDNGASAVATTAEHKNGNLSAKVTNSLNMANVTSDVPARIRLTSNLISGYSYYVSMWVKTTAPQGTMSYGKSGNELFARQPGLEIGNKLTNYTCSSDWTLVTIKTEQITSTGDVYIDFYIPTGSEYVTYVDDIIISIAE